MGVLTRLPEDLRSYIADLDPAADGDGAPAPDPDRLMVARATAAQHKPRRLLLAGAAAAVVLAVTLAVVLVGRNHSKQSAAPNGPLYGVTWTDRAAGATVIFKPGTVLIDNGCERITRQLTVTADRFRVGADVGPGGSCAGTATPRPGDPDYPAYHLRRSAYEQLLATLETGPQWSVSGHALTLTSATTATVVLSSGPTPPALYGITWTDAQAQSSVVFKPGRADLQVSCDKITRALTVTGDQLRLGATVGPSTPCKHPLLPAVVNSAIDQFSRVLESGPRWSVTGDVLTLTAASGEKVYLSRGGTGAAALYGVAWNYSAAAATLVFTPDTVRIRKGCPVSATQQLVVVGNRLRFGARIGKEVVCSHVNVPGPGEPGYGAVQRQYRAAKAFGKVLTSGPRWSVTGNTLILRTPTGASIELTADRSSPTSLPGTRWVIEGYPSTAGGGGASELGATLTFDVSGSFRFEDNCGSFFGTYSVAGHTVTFDLRQTRGTGMSACTTISRTTIEKLLSQTDLAELETTSLLLRDPRSDAFLHFAFAA